MSICLFVGCDSVRGVKTEAQRLRWSVFTKFPQYHVACTGSSDGIPSVIDSGLGMLFSVEQQE